jgi:glycosyltransferase involved in cell wall biosynthesis
MRITVVTVSFNSARTIADTLASVARQDWPDFEHVVVDGASTDGTMKVVEAHAHDKLKALSEADEGLYDAMNKGLRMATGDYVIFLNSDDYFSRADALSIVCERIRDTGADCIFADTEFVKADGRKRGNRVYSARLFKEWWIRIGAMPPHPSMFVRRDLLLRLGGFNSRYRIAADFDFIARAIYTAHCTWAVLPVIITKFRVGGVSTRGLSAKLTISREMASSLSTLGFHFAPLAVQFRVALKALQFRWR